MPRNGSGVYSVPANTLGSPGADIVSAYYNAFIADLTSDLNAARPITAGGTGATSVESARTNLLLTNSPVEYPSLTGTGGLTTANVPTYVKSVRVLGRSAIGDGGHALYVWRASAPTDHTQYVTSADGAIWELAELTVNEIMCGADPTGVADSTTALQSMLTYMAARKANLRGVDGATFKTTAKLTALPKINDGSKANVYTPGPFWRWGHSRFVCHAASVISAMIQYGTPSTPVEGDYQGAIWNGLIEGGIWDCNDKAERAIYVALCFKVTVRDCEVRNMMTSSPRGVQIGTAGGITGYEGFVQNVRVVGRLPLATCRAGSKGIWFENCTDNETRDNVISGVLVAVSGDSTSIWDGKHHNHGWNWPENGYMDYFYDLGGDNVISNSQGDGPMRYFARFVGPRNTVIGAKVNSGAFPAVEIANEMALFRLEGSGTVTVTNSGFKGTASRPIGAEVSLGSGVPASAYRKDNSNHYLNVTSIAAPNIVVGAIGHVTISGTTPTLHEGVNVASVVRNSIGDYRITLNNAVSANAPVFVTASPAGAAQCISATEVKASRTTTFIRLLFTDKTDALIDPGAFSFEAKPANVGA